MIERKRKLAALGLALMGLVLALLLPQVVVGERTVATNSAATAPGLPPLDPSVTDDTPFYPDDPEHCAQRGDPHEYTRDEPKESPHAFGPALGGGGTDGAIVEDFFTHLCGEGGFPDNAIGPDRMFGRAIESAVFGIDPNQPFDSTWREDQRHLVLSIDWMNIMVKRGVMSAPGTWSEYMYVDESGVTRVGVVEVKPRPSTYLVVPVFVDETSIVTIYLRVDCGGQVEFLTKDQVPIALLP